MIALIDIPPIIYTRLFIKNRLENVFVTCLTRFLVFDPVPSIRIPGVIQEEFEDTKGAIRIRISKKNRQHNGQ
jgi:hypothetical protein